MRNRVSTMLWMSSQCVLTLAVALGAAHAQTGAGSGLSGHVADSSGASMPGVNVTVARPDTGFARAISTNANGNWEARFLQQIEGGTRLRLYRREGSPGNLHDHSDVRTIVTVSDSTDGLEVTSRPLPGFPQGLLVMMNSSERDFLLYDWRDLTVHLRD